MDSVATEHQHKLLLLGNGPSLKKEFFDCFADITCLGMNAAYRYWHEISWYPQIYCSLDDQLTLSHADAIRDLIKDQLCQVFFLHHSILDRYSELATLSNIYFLPQLCPGQRNKEKCERLNMPHRPSEWFESCQPTKLTTGAYGVRFGAYLGYRKIGLVGTDCRYVEIVQGARLRDGIVLEVVDTPSNNPNYFFGDYQRVGDRYNLPNPAVHGGNVHVQAFEALAQDVKSFKWDLDVSICTTQSELYEHEVFPYVPLHRFIARAALSAVFMPFTKRDIDLLEQNLLRWGQQEFAPFSEAPAKPTIELHLAMNASTDGGAESRLKDAFHKARLGRFFRGPFFHYSNLSGLDDLYMRVAEGDVGPAGYKAGPNNQFFDIITKFSRGMSHILLMEPDAVPIRANWLNAAERIVRGSDRFWVCGSQYRGSARIKFLSHINGNAIYNVGDVEFRTFFENVFLPHFYRSVKNNPKMCYDIALSDMFAEAYVEKPSTEIVSLWKETAHLFRFSEWVVNVSHAKDREAGVLMSTAAARKRYPNSYIFHGAVDNLFGDGVLLSADTDACSSSTVPAWSPEATAAKQVHMISLNPQLIDSLGHPLAYDAHLRSACAERGVRFVSAANARVTADVQNSHPYVRPVFSDVASKSGVVEGVTEPAAKIMETFRREVGGFVDKHLKTCAAGDKVILYLYTGGLPHVEVLYDIIRERPQVSAHITLFWLGFRPISREYLQRRWADSLRKAILEPRLALTVLTREMQSEIQEAVGVVLPVAPAPTAAFEDVEARSVLEQSELRLLDDTEKAAFDVLFPGLMRRPKGYDLGISVIKMLSEMETGNAYRCTVRHLSREGIPLELTRLVQEVRGLASIVEGVLPPEEFQRMLKEADIIVLPYQPSEFSNRPSSILIEALYFGVPVVAQRGTWLGNLVAKYECGAVAETAEPEAYVTAIEAVAANQNRCRENAISAGKDWFTSNNWATLLDFILEPPPVHDSNCVFGSFPRGADAHIEESGLIATLLADQAPTGIMIDVGAMHGAALSLFLRKGWQVFAFEPDPANRRDLETCLGHMSNLTIDCRAVADRIAESLPFYSSPESPGISTLHPFNESHEETCTVSTTTIADFVREKDLKHIDYLKIDAEGYDLQVLQGVPWDSIKPGVIMCEFEDSKTKSLGYTMHDMARYLMERGYTVLVSEWHPIIRYGIKHDWRRLVRYPCELDSPDAWGNLIALLEDPGDDRLRSLAMQTLEVSGAPARDRLSLVAPTGRSKWAHRQPGIPYRLAEHVIGRYPGLTADVVRRHPRLANLYRRFRDKGLSPVDAVNQDYPPMSRTTGSILIIGSGSSTRCLAHVGFDRIPEDVATFGMGAEYRYYRDIGWWPTYYALCDSKVVLSHKDELKAIIEDPSIPVHKYFFSLKISDHETLEVVPHSSTGDFCVRKAIELGYKRIFMIGIETDYVEQIKESRELAPEEIEQLGLGQLEYVKQHPEGIRIVTKTPLINTNYFFDSYQREGDIYSLPRGNRHYLNWHDLADLAKDAGVEIINLSPTSPLPMFPKASLADFLDGNTSDAFAVPKHRGATPRGSRKGTIAARKGPSLLMRWYQRMLCKFGPYVVRRHPHLAKLYRRMRDKGLLPR